MYDALAKSCCDSEKGKLATKVGNDCKKRKSTYVVDVVERTEHNELFFCKGNLLCNVNK